MYKFYLSVKYIFEELSVVNCKGRLPKQDLDLKLSNFLLNNSTLYKQSFAGTTTIYKYEIRKSDDFVIRFRNLSEYLLSNAMSSGENMFIVNERTTAKLSSTIEERGDPRPLAKDSILTTYDPLLILNTVLRPALRRVGV